MYHISRVLLDVLSLSVTAVVVSSLISHQCYRALVEKSVYKNRNALFMRTF